MSACAFLPSNILKRLAQGLQVGFYSSISTTRTTVGSKAAHEQVQYTEEAPRQYLKTLEPLEACGYL